MSAKSNKEDPKQGNDFDALEMLAADQTLGPHASLVREVAGLRLETKHLKRRNLRVWSAVVALSTSFIIVIGAMFWWFPKYRYLPTTDNRAICEVSPENQAHVTPATVEDFAKMAVLHAYSYDYINYRDRINETTDRFFSEKGRKAYMKSLDDSGNAERVVKGRLVMRSYSTNAPQLETEGLQGLNKVWTVEVPMAIEFYVGGQAQPTNTQFFIADVTVLQETGSAMNPKGISIDSIILKPSARPR